MVGDEGKTLIELLRRRRKIHHMAGEGAPVEDIGDALGLSSRTVQRELSKALPQLFDKSELHRWIDDAICTPEDTELFFPSVNGKLAAILKRKAAEICGMCPVQKRCRQAAFDACETYGVWGGVDMATVAYVYDERTGKISAFQKVG